MVHPPRGFAKTTRATPPCLRPTAPRAPAPTPWRADRRAAHVRRRVHSLGDVVVFESGADERNVLSNPCDASGRHANGTVGDCTSSLASGASCTPTCDSGYTLSGTRSCSAGTLTDTAVCTANSPQATPSSPANSSVSSIPPPPSPSSPQPPQLIKDDDDAAHVTNNLLGTLILACMTLLL